MYYRLNTVGVVRVNIKSNCYNVCFFFSHFYSPASGQCVVTGVVPVCTDVLSFEYCGCCQGEHQEQFLQYFFSFFSHFYSPASGQCVVTGVVPSPPRFLPSIFVAHRVQHSPYSSIFHRVLLTHALAFSASQFVHKKTSPHESSMRSAGLELTKLTCTRLEDNLIRHRGDRLTQR